MRLSTVKTLNLWPLVLNPVRPHKVNNQPPLAFNRGRRPRGPNQSLSVTKLVRSTKDLNPLLLGIPLDKQVKMPFRSPLVLSQVKQPKGQNRSLSVMWLVNCPKIPNPWLLAPMPDNRTKQPSRWLWETTLVKWLKTLNLWP